MTGPEAAAEEAAVLEAAVEEAAVELEEPPQAVRAAAAPQAAAAVVLGSRSLLLTLEYRKTDKTGMELFRAGLYFLQTFFKKMHFLKSKSALS